MIFLEYFDSTYVWTVCLLLGQTILQRMLLALDKNILWRKWHQIYSFDAMPIE